jgi:ABC-type branched-subunit amino acid transport system substrate-binding protein
MTQKAPFIKQPDILSFIIIWAGLYVSSASTPVYAAKKPDNAVKTDIATSAGVLPAKAPRLLIGSTMALSGSHSGDALAYREGSSLYFDRVNRDGGINGQRIENIVYDDAYDPKLALLNVKKLVNEDRVFALFQIYGDRDMRAIMPFCEKHNVPIVAPISGSLFLRNPVHPNIFVVRTSDMSETAEMVKYLVDVRHIREISFVDEDNAYGIAGKSALQFALNKHKVKRASGGVIRQDLSEIDKAIDKAIDDVQVGKPKAVILWSDDKTAVAFIKRSLERKFKPYFLVSSFVTTDWFLRETAKLEADIFASQPVPFIISQDSQFTQGYLKETKAAGKSASTAGFEGYLNAAVLVEGLRKAGGNQDRGTLIAALESMKSLDLGGVKLSFSSGNHEGIGKSTLVKVQAGMLIYLYYF